MGLEGCFPVTLCIHHVVTLVMLLYLLVYMPASLAGVLRVGNVSYSFLPSISLVWYLTGLEKGSEKNRKPLLIVLLMIIGIVRTVLYVLFLILTLF